MSNWKNYQSKSYKGFGVKKNNSDGTKNKDWEKLHGSVSDNKKLSDEKLSDPIDRRDGMEDWAQTSEDF